MSSNRPEPVLDQAKIASTVTGVLTALASLAVVLGYATDEQTSVLSTAVVGIVGGVVTIVNFVVPVWRAKFARNDVTPLADPQTREGAPLVVGSGDTLG